MDDFEGFKTLVEEVTADVVETARDLELAAELENVTELLQSQNLKDEELYLIKKMVSWDGNYCRFIEMTKDLANYINWLIRQQQGFKRFGSILREVLCVKCCQTALHVTDILFLKTHQCSKFVLFFKMATTTQNFSNHHLLSQQPSAMEAEPFTSKKVMTGWC